MLFTQKVKNFLLVCDEIKKDYSNDTLLDRKIIDDNISSSSSASSFFDVKKKRCDDIIVFVVKLHVSAEKSAVVTIANQKIKKFSFQTIDIVSEIH